MSHPSDLIELIRKDVERDYDPAGHEIVIEKAIPGTRFFPDLLVRSVAGDIVCVVEIGYTRPEKLSYYRNDLLIPDVRWYSKDGCLHTAWERRNLEVEIKVQGLEPAEVALYVLWEQVACQLCLSEDPDMPEAETYAETAACLVTDYSRAWMPTHCNRCDGMWLEDQESEHIFYDLAQLRPVEFGQQYGARKTMSWAEAVAHIQTAIGFEFRLADMVAAQYLVGDGDANLNELLRKTTRAGRASIDLKL